MAEAFLYGVGGGGQSAVLSAVTLSSNGTYYASAFSVDGFDTVTVDVSGGVDELMLKAQNAWFGSVVYSSTSVQIQQTKYCITGIELTNRSTSITESYFFAECYNLQSVICPKISRITGSYAFSNCTNLRYVSFNSNFNFAGTQFINCYRLSSVNGFSSTVIGSNMFQNCFALTSAILSGVSSIGSHGIDNIDIDELVSSDILSIGTLEHARIKRISLPNCTYFEGLTGYCCALTDIYLPNASGYLTSGLLSYENFVTIYAPKLNTGVLSNVNCQYLVKATIGNSSTYSSMFSTANRLMVLSCPSLKSITKSSFICYQVPELRTLVLDVCSNITSSIGSCPKLSNIYILSSSICKIAAGVFNGTPLVLNYASNATIGKLCTVYVPSELYSGYLVETNWVQFSSCIKEFDGVFYE